MADVVRYYWGWTAQPLNQVTTTAGASRTVTTAPPAYGTNIFYLVSEDAVGNKSVTRSYSIVVDRPSPAVAAWRLEQWPQQAAEAWTDEATGAHPLTPGAGVTWTADSRLPGAGTATFGGTGTATAQAPSWLNTTQSFSVSAWVRIASTATSRAVASQDGAVMSGFVLGYSQADNRWAMQMAEADATNAARPKALSLAAPVLDTWTHLTGVYDAPSRRMTLYVNGVRQAGTSLTAGFNATGALLVGRSRYNGSAVDFFAGQIADVKVWNRALVDQDFTGSVTEGLPGMFTPIELGRWSFEAGLADTSPWAHDLTGTTEDWGYTEGGRVGYDAQFNTDQWNATGGVKEGYAQTVGPVLRTDASFTVSAWMNVQDTTLAQTAVSQDGVRTRGFFLGYSPSVGLWSFTMSPTDSDDPTIVRANSVTVPEWGAWAHLTGVYDAAAGQLRLYVNGELEATAAFTSTWNATGPLAVGRVKWNGYFASFLTGDVDEVRVFAGAMTDAQVSTLYGEF